MHERLSRSAFLGIITHYGVASIMSAPVRALPILHSLGIDGYDRRKEQRNRRLYISGTRDGQTSVRYCSRLTGLTLACTIVGYHRVGLIAVAELHASIR